jgi:adenylate cyclase, class 2
LVVVFDSSLNYINDNINAKNMNEIEVKILEINQDDVISKLEKLGAEKIFDGWVESRFFDYPDNSLRAENKLLRIRSTSEGVVLGYKEKISQEKAKIMDEREVVVGSYEEIKSVLNALGFEETIYDKKYRTSYKINNVRFEIDTLENQKVKIPTFLEIEAESIDILYEYIAKLGFSKEDAKAWSGYDVLKHYENKKE